MSCSIRCLIIGVLMMFPTFAYATTTRLAEREARLDATFKSIGAYFHIPHQLLKAIARQESGCQPLVLNIKGRDYYPRTKEEAILLCAVAERLGVQYDVGLMQINRYWIHKYNLPHALLFNAEDNLYTACFILSQEINRVGFGWKAVGYYHSKTKWRAKEYAKKVRGHLLNILGNR